MTNPNLNPILFLLKGLEDNLDTLSQNINHSEAVVVNMRRDWIALYSKYQSFKEELDRAPKASRTKERKKGFFLFLL